VLRALEDDDRIAISESARDSNNRSAARATIVAE
jgi:hypothetical protein